LSVFCVPDLPKHVGFVVLHPVLGAFSPLLRMAARGERGGYVLTSWARNEPRRLVLAPTMFLAPGAC